MKYYIKDLLKTILIGLVLILIYFNYSCSVNYCNVNNIPLNYVLVVSGVNIVLAMTLTLCIFESLGIYYLGILLKRIPFIDSLCNH